MNNTAKASLWFTICSILQKSVYFFIIPIYTRILSINEYGIYSLFLSWATIIYNFSALNLAGNSFNVGLIKYSDDRNKYVSSTMGLIWVSTIFTFIIFFILKFFNLQIIDFNDIIVIFLFLDLFAQGTIDLWTNKQKFDLKYKNLVLITLFITFSTPVLSIILVKYFKWGSIGAILGKILILCIVGFILARNILKSSKNLFDEKYWEYGLKFNIPLLAYYLSLSILNQSDRIMISYYTNEDYAGIYSIAYSLAMILTILNTTINSVFIPWEYKTIKNGNEKEIKKIANILIIIIALLNFLLIAVAPEIIHIFTTKEYYQAIWVIPPVALSSFLICLFQFFVNIEFYFEEKKMIMYASVFVALTNILLNAVFIPIYGFIAAGYTTLFSYLMFTLFHYVYMKKTCVKNSFTQNIYNIKFFFLVSFCLITFSFIMLIFYENTIIRYLLILLLLIIFSIILIKKKSEIKKIIYYIFNSK